MTEIRKVPASAGARWLLDGIAIWRRSPLRLAQLGMLFGMTVMLAVSLSALNPALGMILQLVIMLLVPVMMGGLIWAVREAEQGGQPRPGHLLEGTREGRLPHLMLAVLPGFIAYIVLVILFLLLLGTDGSQRLIHVLNELNSAKASGQAIDPQRFQEMIESLPALRILFLIGLSALATMAIALMLALMLPQVMFQQRNGIDALLQSLRSGLANLPAMALFYATTLLGLFALNILMFIPTFILALFLSVLSLLLPASMLQILAMLLSTALLMLYTGTVLPVTAASIYSAWKDLFAKGPDRGAVPPPAPGASNGNSGVIEV